MSPSAACIKTCFLDNFSNYCPQLHAATHHSRQHPTTALKHLYQFLNPFDCKFAFEKLRVGAKILRS